MGYNGANLALAQCWLSLWRDDRPPTRSSFERAEIWSFEPAMVICHVVREQSLTCVSAGSVVRTSLGFDCTNQDLLALTPIGRRDELLRSAWMIVQGAVSVLYREFKSVGGSAGFAQGIAIPFADLSALGGYYLMHTNWRPVGDDWHGHVSVDLHEPRDRQLISFVD